MQENNGTDNKNNGKNEDSQQDNRRLSDIPVKLNKLPWERDFESSAADPYANPSSDASGSADSDVDNPGSLKDDDLVERSLQEASKDTVPSDGSLFFGSKDLSGHNAYRVGTRTYASPETAIDSAASDKIFAMEVDEYEEDRSKIRIFFDVLLGKIWKLMSLNLLTALYNLPALLFMVFFCIYYMQLVQPDVLTSTEQGGALSFLLIGYLPLALVFMAIPVVAFGPAQAGLHSVLRNYAYEQPVFLMSDFRDKVRENFKQGLAVTFINLIVFVLAMLDIYMYPRMLAQTGAWLLVANYLLILAFVVFVMVNMYIYPMMIRYQLTVKNLYRNALLLAIGRFLPNLLVLVLVVALSYGPFLLASLFNNYVAYLLVYVYQVVLGITLPGLVMSYILNPAMDKVMMPKLEEEVTDNIDVK